MSRLVRAAPPLALVLLAVPAAAQSREGIYAVTGTDGNLGPYTGHVELRAAGAGAYDYVREVAFARPVNGRDLTTIWTGRATPSGNDLVVDVALRRMDWITELNGQTRTAADKTPLPVRIVYRPDPAGGLAGSARVQGAAVAEALVRTGPPGATPIFVPERSEVSLHGRPPAWLRSILFGVFANYHTLPEIGPHTSDPRFQAAVHLALVDRTGFDRLRRDPAALLLVDEVVDPISLAEADARRRALGLRLHEKAARYDRDAETRHLDSTGLLAFGIRQTPQGPRATEDMSTFLWSACYLYGQACRWKVTGDAQARANVAAMAEVFCDMIEIDPRPGEFARSLRPIGRAPLTGRWHAGQGRYAHLAWHDNGNNDMIKGFWLAFLAAWDTLPQGHALRPRIERCVREVADSWATSNPSGAGGTGHRRDKPFTTLLNNMLAFHVTGDSTYRDAYRRQLRRPRLLLELATGANFHAYGIADWSGTHLGICSRIAAVELADRLGSRWRPLFEFSVGAGHWWIGAYARSTAMWSIAHAGYNADAGARAQALATLQEFPYPKPRAGIDHRLAADWVPSPFPSLPWKLDWMTSPGRQQSLHSRPLYQTQVSNYAWRSGPLQKGGPPRPWEHHGGDYLFAYWVGRHLGVFSATD